MRGDWIRLHRQVIDSQVFSDHKLLAVWIWCLCKAGYKTRFFQGQKVEPGQFVTGRQAGSESLGMSPSAFYRSLQKLQDWGQIKLEANSKWTTVTICNWRTYQDDSSAARTASEQRADSERTQEKKVKKVKKVHSARPSLAEVQDYCRERGNRVDAEHWYDHYESNGWLVGKSPMKNWKAAVRTWEKNGNRYGEQKQNDQPAAQPVKYFIEGRD